MGDHRIRMCTICLDLVHETAGEQTINCTHVFHPECLKGLSFLGVENPCPMCPVGKERPGSVKVFEEGCRSFVALQRRINKGEASWSALSTLQQRDMDEAMAGWLDAASTGKGLPSAQCVLGAVYQCGQGVSENAAEAVRWFQLSASQGWSPAIYSLGLAHRARTVAGASDEQAARYFLDSASKGHAESQAALASMYLSGEGVEVDEDEARRWFRKAADQGLANAQFNLGCLWEFSSGEGDGDAEAVRWYRKAADQGHANAQFNLGIMFEDGRGVRASEEEAVRWYSAAASQGHPSAAFNLGCMLEANEERQAEAALWYEVAAKRGHANAKFNLGLMYKHGRGVPLDLTRALELLLSSAGEGDERANVEAAALVKATNDQVKGAAAAAQAEPTPPAPRSPAYFQFRERGASAAGFNEALSRLSPPPAAAVADGAKGTSLDKAAGGRAASLDRPPAALPRGAGGGARAEEPSSSAASAQGNTGRVSADLKKAGPKGKSSMVFTTTSTSTTVTNTTTTTLSVKLGKPGEGGRKADALGKSKARSKPGAKPSAPS